MKKEEFPLLPKIINGGIAGIIGVTCVFPMDLVKTRLQNQQRLPNGEKFYRNMIDCFIKIFKSEGYLGMYKGSAVNILLITPEKAVKLTANDFFRFKFRKRDGYLPLSRQMFAGALAALCQNVITCPMELLKIQMQDYGRVAASAKAQERTIFDMSARRVALDVLKARGVVGLYRGLGVTLIRDVIFSVIYFPLYFYLHELGPKRGDGKTKLWFCYLSGCSAAATSVVASHPFDVIKTRLQAMSKVLGEDVYKGVFDCGRKTYDLDGSKAFYKGLVPRILVIAPMFGIAQAVYYLGLGESFINFMRKHENRIYD